MAVRWREVALGDIAEVRLGRQRSPKNHTGDHMRPYLRAANVTWTGLDLTDVKSMNFSPSEADVYTLESGDIVMSEASGSISEAGKPALWRNEIPGCCLQNTLIRIRPSTDVDPEFLYYRLFLQAASGGWTQGVARGVGIHHLGAQRVAAWRFALPQLSDQKAIVADLQTRLSHVDAGSAYLERALARVSRTEESLLVAGITGRLVNVADAANSTEAQLLSILGAEPERPTDLTGLPKVPDHWRWVSLGSIAAVVGGVTKDSKRQNDPAFVEVPYLRVANVQRGSLLLDDVATIRVPAAKAEALALQPGDVLFNEGGDRDKLGRGWVWDGQLADCIHQNHVFRARLTQGCLDPRFLSWYGNSAARHWFEAHGKQTTNLASINLATLKSLPVPVPPPSEQQAIVAELERRLSLLRAARSSTARSGSSAQALRSAVTAQALLPRQLAATATSEGTA